MHKKPTHRPVAQDQDYKGCEGDRARRTCREGSVLVIFEKSVLLHALQGVMK